jgi:hypothetical protein
VLVVAIGSGDLGEDLSIQVVDRLDDLRFLGRIQLRHQLGSGLRKSGLSPQSFVKRARRQPCNGVESLQWKAHREIDRACAAAVGFESLLAVVSSAFS